jgi:hypothetical protein
VNLEGAVLDSDIISSPTDYDKFNLFSSSASLLEFLSRFNVAGVSLANNHSYDYIGGVEQTKQILGQFGIAYGGLKSCEYFEVKLEGKSFIFYCSVSRLTDCSEDALDNLNVFEYKRTLNNINTIRREHPDSVLIFYPHWGYELKERAQPADVKLVEDLVKLGVDYIFGHHPHLIQVNPFHPRCIYSLGNFILGDGPYDGRILSYSKDSVNYSVIVEVKDSQEFLPHLFYFSRSENKYFYKGILDLQGFEGDNSVSSKGLPTFTDWDSINAKLGLLFLSCRKKVRRFLIMIGLHKPYNW